MQDVCDSLLVPPPAYPPPFFLLSHCAGAGRVWLLATFEAEDGAAVTLGLDECIALNLQGFGVDQGSEL